MNRSDEASRKMPALPRSPQLARQLSLSLFPGAPGGGAASRPGPLSGAARQRPVETAGDAQRRLPIKG